MKTWECVVYVENCEVEINHTRATLTYGNGTRKKRVTRRQCFDIFNKTLTNRLFILLRATSAAKTTHLPREFDVPQKGELSVLSDGAVYSSIWYTEIR